MNTPALKTRSYEFTFPDVDTLLKVETPDPETVIVRATRNSFSERRKIAFIRQLAAEGFIADGCQWYPLPAGMPQIHWVVDVSWLRLSQAAKAHSRRLTFFLVGGGLVAWTGLLTSLLLLH
ncbi:hypothetical protein [Opitutus sp. ER46]|uniref:hypothetical protein n=1 Tax=Opitutus sp. ER46 TaxID=2161864 RepID=UPI000D30FE7F|nr:hypothetical protein [Opitutus sp. ER46]PTX92574.1 hypothetical protein DB354_14695 [Opitutus sp. ER46]